MSQVYCVLCSRPGGSTPVCGALETQLQRCAAYCRLAPGVWLVLTSEDADALDRRLVRCLSGDDQLLIRAVGEPACDWLRAHRRAARWLHRHG